MRRQPRPPHRVLLPTLLHLHSLVLLPLLLQAKVAKFAPPSYTAQLLARSNPHLAGNSATASRLQSRLGSTLNLVGAGAAAAAGLKGKGELPTPLLPAAAAISGGGAPVAGAETATGAD